MTEKTDLQAEAKKLGLDDSGTTANLKARLAAFEKQTKEQEAAARAAAVREQIGATDTSTQTVQPDNEVDSSGGHNSETPDEPAAAAPVEEDTLPNDYNIGVGHTDKGFLFGTSNRFSIGGSERYGLKIIGISSTNHVGPAPLVIPAAELPELAALLARLVEEE